MGESAHCRHGGPRIRQFDLDPRRSGSHRLQAASARARRAWYCSRRSGEEVARSSWPQAVPSTPPVDLRVVVEPRICANRVDHRAGRRSWGPHRNDALEARDASAPSRIAHGSSATKSSHPEGGSSAAAAARGAARRSRRALSGRAGDRAVVAGRDDLASAPDDRPDRHLADEGAAFAPGRGQPHRRTRRRPGPVTGSVPSSSGLAPRALRCCPASSAFATSSAAWRGPSGWDCRRALGAGVDRGGLQRLQLFLREQADHRHHGDQSARLKIIASPCSPSASKKAPTPSGAEAR